MPMMMPNLPRPIDEYVSELAGQVAMYREADPNEIDPETAHMMHVDGEISDRLRDWLEEPDGDVPRVREHLEILREAVTVARHFQASPDEADYADEWQHTADVLAELVAWLKSIADPRDN